MRSYCGAKVVDAGLGLGSDECRPEFSKRVIT